MLLREATRQWIAEDIDHERGRLTSMEKWLHQQPMSDMKTELFRFINFNRNVLRDKEARLKACVIDRSAAGVQRPMSGAAK